jgi:hypothetical protein
MDDGDLEKRLINGKIESDCFFSQTDYRMLRDSVLARTVLRHAGKARPLWPFALKAVFVAASLLIMVVVITLVIGAPDSSDSNQAKALSEQKLLLDGGKGALLSYFPVETPDDSKSSLMSVIWDLNSRRSEMLYSTVFKECNETYPASSITFPDNGPMLVLIFSGSSQDGFIDYRIIGYDNDSIVEWWSQDFVPDGKLKVKDGLVIEERNKFYGSGQCDAAVTYIIPYDIQITGGIVLSVQDLQLKIGEQILLIGVSPRPLSVTSESGLIKKVEYAISKDKQSLLEYRATDKGNDVLLLEGENITGSKLNVNIVD